jgi:hypothetical protein
MCWSCFLRRGWGGSPNWAGRAHRHPADTRAVSKRFWVQKAPTVHRHSFVVSGRASQLLWRDRPDGGFHLMRASAFRGQRPSSARLITRRANCGRTHPAILPICRRPHCPQLGHLARSDFAVAVSIPRCPLLRWCGGLIAPRQSSPCDQNRSFGEAGFAQTVQQHCSMFGLLEELVFPSEKAINKVRRGTHQLFAVSFH